MMIHEPESIIDDLRANLEERYLFEGGQTLVRELLQNADDSGATRVRIVLLPGWPDAADHPLLRVPGLLVANDGHFDDPSRQGMSRLGGSQKAADKNSVGRFGLGQKTAFHVCDAFLVVSEGHEPPVPTLVVNPYEVIGRQGDNCLDWAAEPTERDSALLLGSGLYLDTPGRQMVQWYPFRQRGFSPKPDTVGFLPTFPDRTLLDDASDAQWLTGLVSLLRNVRRLEVTARSDKATIIDRGKATPMRFNVEQAYSYAFGGSFSNGSHSTGQEIMKSNAFGAELITRADWPDIRNRKTDRIEKQKALPHGAVVVNVTPKAQGQLDLTWAVFLPVEQVPSRPLARKAHVQIILHGYFFVDSGRNRIAGLSHAPENVSGWTVKEHWNALIRDELVLPMLPTVLHEALLAGTLDDALLHEVVVGLNRTDFVDTNRNAISSQALLARTLSGDMIGWGLHEPGTSFRPLPANQSGLPGIFKLIPDLALRMGDWQLVPTIGPDAVLAPIKQEWQEEELARVVGLLTPAVFVKGGKLERFVEFLEFAFEGRFARAEFLTAPILDLLREAMQSNQADMAVSEHIRTTLGYLPEGSVLPMPTSVMERRALRHTLATVKGAPLCVRSEWCPDPVGIRNVDLDEATALLKALQSHLRNTATEEAAATAAMTILKAMGPHLSTAMTDAAFCDLDILRVDKGEGIIRSASLAELLRAAKAGRLFKRNNTTWKLVSLLEEAAPGAGAMVVTHRDAADLLGDLTDGLEYAADPAYEAAKLAAESEEPGPPAARLALLEEIWSDDPRFRRLLRGIVAGRPDAREERKKLVWMQGGTGLLDDFLSDLLGNGQDTILLSSSILSELSQTRQDLLGIQRVDGAELGRTLDENRETLRRKVIAPDLLEALLGADIPENDLSHLPIFNTTKGRICAAQGFRRNDDWPFPEGMEAEIPRLLAPKGIVARQRFEKIVPPWSREAELRFLLDREKPHRHAEQIANCLHDSLPSSIVEELKTVRWLVTQSGEAVCPADLLDLPGMPECAALGSVRALSSLQPGLLDEKATTLLKRQGVLMDEARSHDRLIEHLAKSSALCWIGERSSAVAGPLQELARGEAQLELPGWPVLAWLLTHKGAEAGRLLEAISTLYTPDPKEHSTWLGSLAPLAAKGNREARMVYDSSFRLLARQPSACIPAILKGTQVPTRTGCWRDACEVVAHGGSVSFAHRLDAELARHLPSRAAYAHAPDAARDPRSTAAPSDLTEAQAAASLKPILTYALYFLPAEMLGVFVLLLGQSQPFRDLLTGCLSLTAATIDGLVKDFDRQVASCYTPGSDASLADRRARMRIRFSPRPALVGTAEFETLAGVTQQLPVGDAEPLELVGSIFSGWMNAQDGTMRRALDVVTPDGASVELRHMTALCMTLAAHYIGSEKDQPASLRGFDNLLSSRANFSEHTAEEVRAELKDQLPSILGMLKPAPGSHLAKARDNYDREVTAAGTAADISRSTFKERLWETIDQPPGHAELLSRIRDKIGEHGYSPARSFFELFQNADDAWQQDPALPGHSGRLVLERQNGITTLRHWGRLVNDTGRANRGESHGWHRDLYHMLVLNLSDKDQKEGLTGRFGLGFKSLHLLGDTIRIASRHVACHVGGGMLPVPWPEGQKRSFDAQWGGRPATIIELEQNAEPAYDQAWEEFRASARWLPAMSRGIRELQIIDGMKHETFKADFTETAAAGVRILSLTGSEPGNALVLDLDHETTLFLPLGARGPIKPPPNTPGLWLLAPLDEDARPGWLLNSRQFRVDPGRGHLSGSLEERKGLFRRHGAALARCLGALAGLVGSDWEGFAQRAGMEASLEEEGRRHFWTALADSFDGDLAVDVLQSLHLDDHVPRDHAEHSPDHARIGWARLVCTEPVFPTRLEPPFTALVRAESVRWQLDGLMATGNVRQHLAGRSETAQILERAVSEQAGAVLQKIGIGRPTRLDGGAFLAEILRDTSRIEPDQAAWLGRVLSPDSFDKLERFEQDGILHRLRQAEFRMADGTWGKSALMPADHPDTDEEVRLILAFAPMREILSSDYFGTALNLYKLAQRGGRLGSILAPRNLANWARRADTLEKRHAALVFLVQGKTGSQMATELSGNRPRWMPSRFDDLCESELADGLDRAQLQTHILPYLYAQEHDARLSGASAMDAPWFDHFGIVPSMQVDADLALERLHDWWNRKNFALAGQYMRETFPEGLKPKDLRDKDFEDAPEAWFTFFAQGVFRTVEWGNATASRNFIEQARRAGWWSEMAELSRHRSYKPWTDRLDELASEHGVAEDYRRWRRALGELYVVARWLPDYIAVFRDLPRFVKRDGKISLEDHWWPSMSVAHQRRGTEGASLIRSMGKGVNWMIREGVRAKLWGDDSNHMHGYGWSNSAAVQRFGKQVGWYMPPPRTGMDASPEIYELVKESLGDRADFADALDLPIHLIMSPKHESDRVEILGPAMDEDETDDIEEDFNT